MSLPDSVKRQLATLKHIEELDLSETGVNNDDMGELLSLIQQYDVKIKHLNIYRTNIRSVGAKLLAQLTDKNIDLLTISCCSTGKEGATALIRSKIKQIDMGDNGFSDPEEVADIFIREGKQTYINLYRNGISDIKMKAVNDKMEQNKREAKTPKYSPPTASLVSIPPYGPTATPTDIGSSQLFPNYSIYKYRGSSPNKTETLPTIEINIVGHQVSISSVEAEKVVSDIVQSFFKQNNPGSKKFLKELKDRIEQRDLTDTNKSRPSH